MKMMMMIKCRPVLLLPWMMMMMMMMIPASTATASSSSAKLQTQTQAPPQPQQEPLFHVNSGPVVTVTLQEGNGNDSAGNKWINLPALCPNIHWSVASRRQPFRRWLPSLQSLQGVVGYQYNHRNHNHPRTASTTTTDTILFPPRRRPDLLDITASFQTPYGHVDVVPQLGSTAGSSSSPPRLLLQWTHPGTGGSILALFQKTSLKLLKGCYQWNFLSSSATDNHNTNNMNTMGLEAIRLTPSYSFAQHQPSCLLEATTTSQRTKTILNLQAHHPTLTVVHALNDRHVIAPELSLYTARILYQWNVRLNAHGSSIQTKVDPTDSITITWQDVVVGGGATSTSTSTSTSTTGKWICQARIPLKGISRHALGAHIQVQRQFQF